MPQFIWHPNPSANVPKPKDALAIMAFDSGPADVAHLAPVVCYILQGELKLVHFFWYPSIRDRYR